MVDDLEIQDIIQEMRRPVYRPMSKQYFSTRLADALDGYDSCERCAGDNLKSATTCLNGWQRFEATTNTILRESLSNHRM